MSPRCFDDGAQWLRLLRLPLLLDCAAHDDVVHAFYTWYPAVCRVLRMYCNVPQEPRQYSLRKGEVGRLQEAVAAAAAAGSPAR